MKKAVGVHGLEMLFVFVLVRDMFAVAVVWVAFWVDVGKVVVWLSCFSFFSVGESADVSFRLCSFGKSGGVVA